MSCPVAGGFASNDTGIAARSQTPGYGWKSTRLERSFPAPPPRVWTLRWIRCGDDARTSRTSASYPEKSRGKSAATSASAIRVSLEGWEESNVIVVGNAGFRASARPAVGTTASVARRTGIRQRLVMGHLRPASRYAAARSRSTVPCTSHRSAELGRRGGLGFARMRESPQWRRPVSVTVRFRVNGTQRSLTTDPQRRLLDVLREELQLTGTKYGCGEGQCGACLVYLDGEPARSCLLPVRRPTGSP